MDSSVSAPNPNLRQDLCRLARFGANISDAHSCLIFLPCGLLNAGMPGSRADSHLELAGFHSLATDLEETCFIPEGSGLIGWVAKHRRGIHVSPFEHDSRTLGIYRSDQGLKSFIGVPVDLSMDGLGPKAVGVVCCDSKKSFAFSKLQGKLLEDLAREAAHTTNLTLAYMKKSRADTSWRQFLIRAQALSETIGPNSFEIVRIKTESASRVERQHGSAKVIAMREQLERFISQALPPNSPTFCFPHGDILIAVDTMVSSFYENKIRALASQVGGTNIGFDLKFIRQSFRDRKNRAATIEDLAAETAGENDLTAEGVQYEYRRA